MKKLAIFIFVIIVYCYGCKKDYSFTYSSSLIGKWSWFISCGGFAGCQTPESEHVKVNIVFTADSIYKFYQNDTLKESIGFHTYISPTSDLPGTADIIKFDSGSQLKFSITHDTLSLSYNRVFGSSYKRIK
jgi:hypothetical protein